MDIVNKLYDRAALNKAAAMECSGQRRDALNRDADIDLEAGNEISKLRERLRTIAQAAMYKSERYLRE